MWVCSLVKRLLTKLSLAICWYENRERVEVLSMSDERNIVVMSLKTSDWVKATMKGKNDEKRKLSKRRIARK